MDIQEKIAFITRNTEEVMTREDLQRLLESKEQIRHYIGFEISGKIHLGTGLMCMAKIKDFMDAGIHCTIFLADWHAWINDKLGGNREVIKHAANYFMEGMKASFLCIGGDPKKLNFVLGSDVYHQHDDYWATMIDVCKNTSLARMQRSITIMGRKEGESVDFAKLIYPAMQVADIFFQGIHLAHAGLDQRKAHVVARDVALQLNVKPLLNKKKEKIKPIAIHHHLLLGLGKPPVWPIPKEQLQELQSALKMSKSNPETCVFIHDTPEDIRRKMQNAFCPEGETAFNPVLDWAKHLIFRDEKSVLLVERPAKFGGPITYTTFAKLEKDVQEKKLHPLDLKKAVAEKLIEILEPARKHFAQPSVKKLQEEMEKVMITR